MERRERRGGVSGDEEEKEGKGSGGVEEKGGEGRGGDNIADRKVKKREIGVKEYR